MINKIREKVVNFKSKLAYGLTDEEVTEIIGDIEGVNKDILYDFLMKETSSFSKGEVVRYHSDVIIGIGLSLGIKKEEIFGVMK